MEPFLALSLQMHAPTLRVLAVQLAHRNSPTGDRDLTILKILNLTQNHHSGEISGELPIGLNYLDLSSNAFSSVIPMSVANLTQLQLINLLYNQFSSEIPTSFSELQQLQYLKIFWFFIIYFFIFVVFQWFLTKITWLFSFSVNELVRFFFFFFFIHLKFSQETNKNCLYNQFVIFLI